MKRKHHEIAGSSDQQPNVKRTRRLLPSLTAELVRRISEFVVELTRFVGMFPMLSQLRYPRIYDIQLTDDGPFAHLPLDYRQVRTHRFTRLEIANGQRYAIFQTLQAAGYWFIRIPIHFIHSLTENLN